VISEAQGQREAAITLAEGHRQAAILGAERERQSAILRAEGLAGALEKISALGRGRHHHAAPVPRNLEGGGEGTLDQDRRSPWCWGGLLSGILAQLPSQGSGQGELGSGEGVATP
jgi:hypothetical protein